jgi:hypothetical protein
MMTALTALRDKLALVTGVATCKVGMESNMTPADYPMVRIVPSVIRDAPIIGQRRCDVLVYFGQPIHEFTGGLESLYTSLFALETALLDAAQATAGVYVEYVETVMDEDRVDAYKLCALRLVVQG